MIPPLARKSHKASIPTFVASIIKSAVTEKDEGLRCAARQNLNTLIRKQPELITPALIALQTATQDAQAATRKAAQQALGALIESRPDIVDATLITQTAKIAVCDCAKDVREAAQNTLEILTWATPHWEWSILYWE